VSERTEAQRVATLEERVDLLLAALRGAFSGMGRQFDDDRFAERWRQAGEDEE